MKITEYDEFNATNYFTVFECTQEDKLQLLNYLSWMILEGVNDKILADSKFSPSDVWKKWLSGNFLAFSENKIIFKSGHKLYYSYDPVFIPTHSTMFLKDTLKLIFNNLKRWISMDRNSPARVENVFRGFYPDVIFPVRHKEFLESHPGAYFRVLEPNILLGNVDRDVLLEIGAGAGVNPIVNYLNYNSKSIIIDLPETISIAFALIKTFIPSARVALPNDVQVAIDSGDSFEKIIERYDFIFILPIQIDLLGESFVDVAFNMASFQEMDISVVRNYIKLIHRVLKPGGHVALLNLEVSRQIKGNSIKEYGLDCFSKGELLNAKFANWQIPSLKHLKYVCFIGSK